MNKLHVYHVTPSVKAYLRQGILKATDDDVFQETNKLTWRPLELDYGRFISRGLNEALKNAS